MTLFIDTANFDEIRKWYSLGVAKGVTTNQKIWSQEKVIDYLHSIKRIAKLIHPYPLSVELTETDQKDEVLVGEAVVLSKLSPNVVIKVPMWGDGRGLKIVKSLKDLKIKINMTCCMDVEQVILASELKVKFVSLFYNRIIDYTKQAKLERYNDNLAKEVALKIIKDSSHYLDGHGSTRLIVGSIRKAEDVVEAFGVGAHIVTVPTEILEQMPQHPKTEETIAEFDKAWQKLQRKNEKLYPIHDHLDVEPCTERCPNFRAQQKEKTL